MHILTPLIPIKQKFLKRCPSITNLPHCQTRGTKNQLGGTVLPLCRLPSSGQRRLGKLRPPFVKDYKRFVRDGILFPKLTSSSERAIIVASLRLLYVCEFPFFTPVVLATSSPYILGMIPPDLVLTYITCDLL